MTSIPLLAADPERDGPSRTFWQVVRTAFFRRWLHRIAVVYVLLVALVAGFVPFIANGRPYSAMVLNDQTNKWEQRYPIFDMLTGVDKVILWLVLVVLLYGIGLLLTRRLQPLETRQRARFWVMLSLGTAWALWSVHLLTVWTIDLTNLTLIGFGPPILYLAARMGAHQLFRRFRVTTLSPVTRAVFLLSTLAVAGVSLFCASQTVSIDVRHDPNDLLHREDYVGIAKDYEVKNVHLPPLSWGFNDQAYPLAPRATWQDPPWWPYVEGVLVKFGYQPHNDKIAGWDHLMGTDSTGRDILSRLLWSTRIVFGIGVISQIVTLLIGIAYGALMGYFGGTVDILGNRLMEIIESIPTYFLIIICVAIFGRQISIIMLILACVSWTGIARFVRADFLKLRNADFVQAAISGGLPLRSILFRHILPNALTPVLVNATFGIAGAVTIESSLSYLGLGVEPPTASWGAMLEEAGSEHLWLALFPGIMIFLTVFAFNIIGEGLRDAIDPKTNKIQ